MPLIHWNSTGIAYVWLAVPAGWFANFLISYMALRKSWPADDEINIDKKIDN